MEFASIITYSIVLEARVVAFAMIGVLIGTEIVMMSIVLSTLSLCSAQKGWC